MQLIKNSSYDFFMNQIVSSKKDISICSKTFEPTILLDVLKNKNLNANLKLISTQNIAELKIDEKSIETIKFFSDHKNKLYNYGDIKANIYIFDQERVWLTSADLTKKSLFGNNEYGVLIDDKKITSEIITDYNEILKNKKCSQIKNESIEKLIKNLNILTFGDVCKDFDEKYLNVSAMDKIININKGWDSYILKILINKINTRYFNLSDLYKYEIDIKKDFPKNNFIKEKIRQILQNLRDIGLIQFIDNNGNYKKLWI